MATKKLPLVLLQLVALLIKFASSQDPLFNLNTKKVVAVTSDKFLSLTLDPAVLLAGDVLASSTELSTNMAKALAPGYVRLAGPRSNAYAFERSLFPQSGYNDPDFIFSEAHWVLVQQWAQRAGLDVVSSLATQRIENEDQTTTWDPKNSLGLISFSDHMGYNISWQLGYECQTRCDISGFDLGKDVARLRSMLSAFPRYSNSVIAGPDIVSFRGKQQQQYIQEFFNAAGNALSVITWHPDFAGIVLDSDGVVLQTDTLAADKDLLYKAIGRSVAKKPLWIAESKPEECKRQFLGALVWARRLGNAAKLGVQVIMRQPDTSTMFQPTPDYWVSLLHKILVGREVLDTKLTSGNRTHVHFYCQCTKPSAKYDRGAVTIFGINLSPSKISVSLKGLKIKAIHKYILMPGYDTDNRMFAETVLLNNEPLTLVNGKNLPEINPTVSPMGKNMAVKLPSGGIGFWVIPGARVKSCLGHDEESGDKNLLLKKLTKKLEEPEGVDENLAHELEDDNHNQDLEVESGEDIKSLLKSKKKKRKYWHSDETEDDDRRFKRIDTKKEFEKLEKFLKRNNNNEEKKTSSFKGRMSLALLESGENKEESGSDEDLGLVRLKKNEKSRSGEEIRTKLEEYKNKLIQYENRKRNHGKHYEETQKISSSRINQPNEYSSTDVDTQKAVEALALISRVEDAIREYGKSGEKINYEENAKNLKRLDLASDIGEEMLIEELEKSDKIKRMVDPNSLGKIYELLVSNSWDKVHKKRSAENLDNVTREKRDLEKLLGDDPLGLRKEGLFKKRLKTDDLKERKFERRHRKKDKEEIGIKKELPVARYDPRISDSNENNFFGFPQMKPLENFPEGDVFFNEGSSSEEKSDDYDYVKEDDDEEVTAKQHKRNNRRRAKSKSPNKDVQDETWVEEANSNFHQAPNEFFEKVNFPTVVIKSQWKDYGELYEPEAVQQAGAKAEQKVHENDTAFDTVIVQDRPDERQDKRAKEAAVKKLINYYDNSEMVKPNGEDIGRERSRPQRMKKEKKFKSATPSQRKMKETPKTKHEETQQERNTKRLVELNNEYENGSDLGSLEFVNSKEDLANYSDEIYEEVELGTKKRPKRTMPSLDVDIFGQEMIREDAGNLKDCKCRVIRRTGKLECKNCQRRPRRLREIGKTIDFTQFTTNDQGSIATESTPEESLTNTPETPEANQEKSATQDVVYSIESIEASTANSKPQKYIEVADLNGEEDDSIVNKQNKDDITFGDSEEDRLAPELLSSSADNADSQIINSKRATEHEIDSYLETEVIPGCTDGETIVEKSTDDTVGSQKLIEPGEVDDAADQAPEKEPNVDQETITENGRGIGDNKDTDEIEKNESTKEISDVNNAKRHISESLDSDSVTSSSSNTISLNTGGSVGSSATTDLGGSKLKNIADLKLKSMGIKNEFGKSKLVLNTEALSALMKESESKRAEVMKALESSTKLKSVDNAKYVEYQRKRDEKLAFLKEKLRERKAKILQQYRQELLDALNKCDDEVERNLKRREIWYDFKNRDEFQDFVDKDKLDYLMMNKFDNYKLDEEKNDGLITVEEDRRYHPEIDFVQPIHSPRQQRIPTSEYRKYFYTPKINQFSSPSQESSFDPIDSTSNDRLNIENLEDGYKDDDPYYAIVESLENPKIFHKREFDKLLGGSASKKYNDHRTDVKYQQPDNRYWRNYDQQEYFPREYEVGNPIQRILPIDRSAYEGGDPVLHLFEEDLRSEYALPPYYNEYLTEYEGIDDPWDYFAQEYNDGILHHRRHSIPIDSGSRQKSTQLMEIADDRKSYDPEEFTSSKRFAFDTKTPQSFCSDGNCGEYRNLKNTEELEELQDNQQRSTDDNRQRDSNEEEHLVRNERYLAPYKKQILDEPEFKIVPVDSRQDLSVRKVRDVGEKQPAYVCLKEDSMEDIGGDDRRLFKLVRNKDHYEAVSVIELPEESAFEEQRTNHRRIAKHTEKIKNKIRKYDAEILTDDKGNYYVRNGASFRKSSPSRQYSGDRDILSKNIGEKSQGNFQNKYKDDTGGKFRSRKQEIDHRLIADDINRLESGQKLDSEEYEVLMLIPVKKHKVKRQKRELDNSIDRTQSYEDMNEFWENIVDIKDKETRLQEYLDAKDKNIRDFEEAQANVNANLKKLESIQDPIQIDKFKKVILNLGPQDEREMAVVAQSQDDLDKIHLGEYLKQKIIKQLENEANNNNEKLMTQASGTTNPSSTLFDATIPKLESTINEELKKVGNLTESLEDFINEFDKKFNGTSEIESNVTKSENPGKKKKISYNIFHTALESVKKFFDFLTGVSLIFRRH